MDINRLLKKRQLNVQEQNALTAHFITSSAKAWREQGVPPCLAQYAESQGVCWSGSIVLTLDVDFPGMARLAGRLLTQHEQFIDFELDTDITHHTLLAVEQWEDVSAEQDLSLSKRGTGKGYGAIALEVRRRLLGVSAP